MEPAKRATIEDQSHERKRMEPSPGKQFLPASNAPRAHFAQRRGRQGCLAADETA